MAKTTNNTTPTRVITGEVRFSYAHVFKPDAIEEGSEPKYSVSLLIPKTDKDTIRDIQKAVEAAKEEGKALWGGKLPRNLKLPLRDGDDEYPDDDTMEGVVFLKANSKTRPGLVDKRLQRIVSPEERERASSEFGKQDPISSEDFYSGCYGRASLKFFAYSKAGNQGIGVLLNNLQKLRDGESLAGGYSAADDFGDGVGDSYEDDDLLN